MAAASASRANRLITDLQNEATGHSGLHASTVLSASATRTPSTKTQFETHIRRCRVRRKRKRLTSNGSIESDAAVGLSPHPICLSPRHFR